MKLAMLPRSAHEPAEARGRGRDDVRLLVGRRGTGAVTHHAFADLPDLLVPGDVVVVNTSATVPAAVPVLGGQLQLHLSTELPDGRALVEVRRIVDTGGTKTTRPYPDAVAGQHFALPGGGRVELVEPYSHRRLWTARVDTGGRSRLAYLERFGAPIRYDYVPRAWPLSAYQTVFSRDPGSAEMPSAGRPFTDRIVTRLIIAGIMVAPIRLHTGVASPEAHERPYPERYEVPESTARAVNLARGYGGRVIAVGTTVVRALETAADPAGTVRAAAGFTDLVVTAERGVRAVSGLLTGFHEPAASRLDLLEAVAGRPLLDACYAQATAERYRWHEFGDVNLLLP
jgi:S-adenosylmethionine:tRNA ribosyltransferase-isomerase